MMEGELNWKGAPAASYIGIKGAVSVPRKKWKKRLQRDKDRQSN
jgi:hypothetical protein